MNIKVTRSSYKNKEGKWAVIFDCSEKNYRKKIKTSLQENRKLNKKMIL